MAMQQPPVEPKLDRETFMLMRHRKLEAYEKAYEIEVNLTGILTIIKDHWS
jgi:hypothetical protein